MLTSSGVSLDAPSTRRAAYRLVCECGEGRIRELAERLFKLVDDNEYSCRFSDAQWDALRAVAESLAVLATSLTAAHQQLETLLVDARAEFPRR